MGLVLPAGPGGVHTPDIRMPDCYFAACATALLFVGGASFASQGEGHTGLRGGRVGGANFFLR